MQRRRRKQGAERGGEGKKNSRARGKSSADTVESVNGSSGETIGIDVGERASQLCRLDPAGEIADEARLQTNAASIERHFAKLPAAATALGAGPQS